MSIKTALICGSIISLLTLTLVVGYMTTSVTVIESKEAYAYSPKDDPYASADNYYKYKRNRRQNGHAKAEAPEEFAKYQRQRRIPVDRTAPEYPENYIFEELKKAEKSQSRNLKNNDLDFIERGPGNVAGRTRAILVLPSDPTDNTWLAAAASGGIWKTTDGGFSWINKTNDFPTLSTNTLAMSASDPSVIYAGTGEHFTNDFDGFGMFKSLDEGETWTQIVRAGDYDAFRNISRIAVDPEDANTLLVTSRNSIFEDSLRAAIYKSTDGGLTWDQKLLSTEDRYDDIAVNPENFNTMYVGVQRLGVLKSTDQGETWENKSRGLQVNGRIEIASSTIDTNYVWGAAQGGGSGTGSDIYISRDGAETWSLAVEEDGAIDFFDGQGWYDNVIEAHPFDKDVAYVGGVNIFKVSVTEDAEEDILYDIEDNGAFEFLDFVNGISVGGGFIPGELGPEDIVSIEIRFGQGGQKAHRFSVNGRGAGVPADDYQYQDYVDVPFQVWDVTNNRQLMVSFRDQQDDGEWTIKERILNSANTSNDSREYIFPHNVDYAGTANALIARNGGQEYRHLFLMWPELREGVTWDPKNSPAVSFSILAEPSSRLLTNTQVISDAYFDFDGNNSFTGIEFANNEGQHPDQHGLVFIIDNEDRQTFKFLSTNDGGVYISNTSTNPGSTNNTISYRSFGYNTTQFYSADKVPGANRYIGGMQDNSTWLTSRLDDADAESFYDFAFGGDGFEVVWNNRDPNLVMGSVQFNSLRRSTDGGRTWRNGAQGIDDDGPFHSRIANTRRNPDRLFTIGSSGVWTSNDFGLSWTPTRIGDGTWSFNSFADIAVSDANPDIIWAGGSMDEDSRLFVSDDGGGTFSPASYYQDADLGFVSGIGVHPTEANTAYALFSFARRTKVLMTKDLGRSWEDITGFENGVSTKGFPDIAVNCLLVFPNDTDRIWVGSELGIIESLDNGASWALMDNNMPAVPIMDLKIQDDQVVVATHGRGIWSVQVEGLQQEFIFAPAITSVNVSPSGGIGMTSIIGNEFDSLRFLIDSDMTEQIVTDVIVGNNIAIPVENFNLPDGEYDFQIIGYLDGISYVSSSFSAFVFDPGDPTASYFNDFSDDALDDFVGNGFSVRLEDGFTDPAIHSPHDYNNAGEIMYQLKTPIMVSEDQNFLYKDVAIIELGRDFARFGEEDFFDFVVVEGSSDGSNWLPLADGYDASFSQSWTTAYNSGAAGRAAIFVEHDIDLKDRFDVDDIVFIRYRLFADAFETGWGWAIDDVEVRLENTTPVFTPEFEELSIYPNPATDVINIDLPSTHGDATILVRDIQGRLVSRQLVPSRQAQLSINASDMRGLFIIEIIEEGILVATEKVVVVK